MPERATAACTCNLDRWEPEPSTGHTWNCDTHRAMRGLEPLIDKRTPAERAYDAWVTTARRTDDEGNELDA